MRLHIVSDRRKVAFAFPDFLALLARVALLSCICTSWSAWAQTQSPEAWQPQVDAVIGSSGELNPQGVLSWHLVRSDLSFDIALDEGGASTSGDAQSDDQSSRQYALSPEMASGLIGFKSQANGQVLMTLEFPLMEEEVNTFVSALQSQEPDQTIRVAAIHNHYLQETPRIIFIHADGLGDPVQLAQAVKTAWDTIQAPVEARGADSNRSDRVSDLGVNEIGGALGGMAEALARAVHVSVGRNESVNDLFAADQGDDQDDQADQAEDQVAVMPPGMGPQSDFVFQPQGNRQAFVIGEICVRPNEANPVMRTLRDNGFKVSALHNHFMTEEPRLFFVHLQATGDARQLAQGIREALDRTDSEHK